MSKLEEILDRQLIMLVQGGEIPNYTREYRFVAELVGLGKGVRKRIADAGLRDWRFDFAFIDDKIALEVNGGTWRNGRHNRGSSIRDEYTKLNAASLLGWRVFLFSTDMVKDETASQTVIDIYDRNNMP